MKKLLLILLCVPLITLSQSWEKTITSDFNTGAASTNPVTNRNDVGHSVQQTTSGGYISAGSGDGSIFLVETDATGNVIWKYSYSSPNLNEYWVGNSVHQTSDGGFVVTGEKYHPSSGAPSTFVFKMHPNLLFDGSGGIEWEIFDLFASYSRGFSIQETNDGGYIVTGERWSGTGIPTPSDVWLFKISPGGGNNWGAVDWYQTYGGLQIDKGRSVQQTSDGGYIICGETQENLVNTGVDVYLIKTDANGVELWNQTFDNNQYTDLGKSVRQTTDGGYIISGLTVTPSPNNQVIWLIKTDGNGVKQWEQTLGNNFTESGRARQTFDGGYIIITTLLVPGTATTLAQTNVHLIKTDGNGVKQWEQNYGTTGINDIGYDVQQTTDGGYIITGTRESNLDGGSSDYDLLLIKTDGNGNVISTNNVPISSQNRKSQYVLDMLGRDINPKKNQPFIEIYNDGTVEKKIIVE